MTYITKYVPNLEELKRELEENPNNIKFYSKYEGFTGDSDSIDYLNEKLNEYYNSKKTEE